MVLHMCNQGCSSQTACMSVGCQPMAIMKSCSAGNWMVSQQRLQRNDSLRELPRSQSGTADSPRPESGKPGRADPRKTPPLQMAILRFHPEKHCRRRSTKGMVRRGLRQYLGLQDSLGNMQDPETKPKLCWPALPSGKL